MDEKVYCTILVSFLWALSIFYIKRLASVILICYHLGCLNFFYLGIIGLFYLFYQKNDDIFKI